MKTILFTNARDESNILEWVKYHIYIGFSKIYIYDHLSIKSIQDIINENVVNQNNSNKVIVEKICSDTIRKTDLMDKSFKLAKNKKYDWMLYLDADEYLVLPNDNNLDSFLEKYNIYQQIGINWLMFGSNFHNEEPEGGLLKNYTKCDDKFHGNVKSFIRPEYVKHVINPHCYKVENNNLSVGINCQKLNNENPWHFELDIPSDKLNTVNAYIAHYIFQSYDTYVKRKKNRKRDDTGTDWHWNFDKNTIHKQFNKITNLALFNLQI